MAIMPRGGPSVGRLGRRVLLGATQGFAGPMEVSDSRA